MRSNGDVDLIAGAQPSVFEGATHREPRAVFAASDLPRLVLSANADDDLWMGSEGLGHP